MTGINTFAIALSLIPSAGWPVNVLQFRQLDNDSRTVMYWQVPPAMMTVISGTVFDGLDAALTGAMPKFAFVIFAFCLWGGGSVRWGRLSDGQPMLCLLLRWAAAGQIYM